MDRWDRTGSAAPGKRGGSAGKLAPYKDFLLKRVKDKPDITMPELVEVLKAETGTEAAPASLSRSLIRHGQRFKKRMARPVRKWFRHDSLTSLHQRIRSRGYIPAKMEIRASWS